MSNSIISICITNKNRSKVITDTSILYLLPDCIKSIADVIEDSSIELIISDWGSTDWPVLDWIEQVSPNIPISIVNVKCNDFSVGVGRNIAASMSNGDMLLFIDTDIILNRPTFYEALIIANQFGVCFPKINYQLSYNKPHYEIHTGAGNVMIKKDLYRKVGLWPEYWSYGFEDIEFANKIKKEIGELKTTQSSFVHQWHPSKHGWVDKPDIKMNNIIEQCKIEVNKEVDLLKKLTILDINNPNTTHSKIKYSRTK